MQLLGVLVLLGGILILGLLLRRFWRRRGGWVRRCILLQESGLGEVIGGVADEHRSMGGLIFSLACC